jgi:hypothetical protein
MASGTTVVCGFCERPKHMEEECWVNPESKNFTLTKLQPLAQEGQGPTSGSATCGWCGRAGHGKEECVFNPQSASYDVEQMKKLARTRLSKPKVFCSLCHRPAHERPDCIFNPKSKNYDPAKTNPRSLPRRDKFDRSPRNYDRGFKKATTRTTASSSTQPRGTPRYFKAL